MSLDMYRVLCQRLEPFPHFLDVLSGFGVKTSEVEEESPVSHQRFHYLQDSTMIPHRCGQYESR